MHTSGRQINNSSFQKILLSPLSLERENSFVLWIILLSVSIMGGGLYYFEGNVLLITGILYLLLAFFLSILRIDFSLYLLMLSVMVFDQHAVPGFTTFTKDIGFFNNLKEISYVPFFEAGVIAPFEIHILFLCFALLLHATTRKQFVLKPITVWIPFLIFFTCFAFSFINGLRGGGDFLIALWEVRALFYLCLMFVLVPQILDSKKQIRILFGIFIIGITFKALQGVGRFIDLGFTTGGLAVLTNHEDPVFAVTLFVLLLGFLIFKTGGQQRNLLLLCLLPLLLGFYVGQRRAAYASLMVCIAILTFLLPPLKRIQFLKFVIPALVGLFLYGAAFWNSNSSLGRPVQMIKSGIVKPDKETNFEDYSSNLYRSIENYNLAQTVVHNPVVGTGFGKKYEQPIPLINIRFTLRDYIPHNQIYWVLVKMGGVGFFAFWYFFNCFAARGTQVFMRLQDPYLKAVTLVVVLAVINQMVVSFFDLQLTYYRNMLYLGCLMGLLPVIENIDIRNNNGGDHHG